MTLYDVVTRGKFFFDVAHKYLEQSQNLGIRDPIEAVMTFGYKHLEVQETFRNNPQILAAIRKTVSGMYENFEKNISHEKNIMVVVNGRRTIDQKISED